MGKVGFLPVEGVQAFRHSGIQDLNHGEHGGHGENESRVKSQESRVKSGTISPLRLVTPSPCHPLTSFFCRSHCTITLNGRAAIAALMEHLRLTREDEVCIITSFDFPNVSSCVTTIFNYCKPSRVLTDATKAVFVIHEFGVPHPAMLFLQKECRQRGIPLIEDCAHTLDSVHQGYRVGTVGDWIICSFPKIFPVSIGGALIGNVPVKYEPTERNKKQIETVSQEVAPYFDLLPQSSEHRREVYHELTDYAQQARLTPVFEVTKGITPWFFPVYVPDTQQIQEVASEAQVDCGLWHGTNVVVFPCHQYLTDSEIERIGAVILKSI